VLASITKKGEIEREIGLTIFPIINFGGWWPTQTRGLTSLSRIHLLQVHKVQHKPRKNSVRERNFIGAKELECAEEWRTGPADSVRCTRTVQSSTSHSREFGDALRYYSSNCPVRQRSNYSLRHWSTLQSATVMNNVVQKSEHRSQRGTRLSVVAPDCPVPLEDKASNGRPALDPNSWLM
jgi:hypothetical protein